MNRLIAFFVEKRVFIDLLTVGLIVIGIGSLFLIRKEVFPNVAFDIITITTVAPGGSAEEVEKLITNPIEQDLQEIDGLKKVLSKSIEGRSFILVQLDPDQTNEDEGKRNIQDVVDRFVLPEIAKQPIVTSVKSNQTPIIEVCLKGDLPDLEMREAARFLEKKIEAIPGVARVVHRGLRDKEVRVEASPKLLSRYRVSLEDLIQSLKRQNVTISAGSLDIDPKKADQKERLVRTIGEFKNLEDIEKVVVRANESAAPIRVKDLARVFYQLEKPELLVRTDGGNSLNLTVLKKAKADAIDVVDALKVTLDQLKPSLDPRLKIEYVNDFSTFIRRRINVLSGNLLLGLILVLLLLSLFLQKRIALLVSIGIPFSFLATMFAFYSFDYSINLVSLLGLIIVSGMLVDDAIVVTDNCARLLEEGADPKTAAIRGTQEIWPAVTASVMTTVVAFLPMMFMSGIFGKFIREIPLGVILALLFSMAESFFALPVHFAHFAQRIQVTGSAGKKSFSARFSHWFDEGWKNTWVPRYVRVLHFVIRYRYRTAFAALLVFVGTISYAALGMRFVLFPPDGAEMFFIRVEAPTGTSLRQTEQLILPLEKIVSSLPSKELKNYVSVVGMHQQDANDPETRRGHELAQITVFLTPAQDRARTVAEVIESLRLPTKDVPGFDRLVFAELNSGPPVGKPVSLAVRSAEYADILPAVAKLKEVLAGYPGVKDIVDSFLAGKEETVVKVNGAEAAAAGLSVASIGNVVRAAYEGVEATNITGLDEEIQVRVSFPAAARSQANTLNEILVPNAFSQLIPLPGVARFEKSSSLALYEHENNEREVRVLADVDITATSAKSVNDRVRAILPDLNKQFPKVRIAFGGEDLDTAESMSSLGRAFVIAFFAIFLILVFTFQNITQPLLVMTTIPMGIMSVVWTFAVHNRPLSFMGMLGIIALGGVIVNNAIIFIDFVNAARKRGADRFESIYQAAQFRIRPIFLTTATTVAGLLPTAYGIGGRDDFVVPIALSLGWGILFGSILTAVLLPTALAILDDINEKAAKLFRSTKA